MWNTPERGLDQVQELDRVGSQGITGGHGVSVVSQETQTWHPPAPVCFAWGGLNKGTMALVSRESCPFNLCPEA